MGSYMIRKKRQEKTKRKYKRRPETRKGISGQRTTLSGKYMKHQKGFGFVRLKAGTRTFSYRQTGPAMPSMGIP